MERYGYESPLQSPKIREKIKVTNLGKYGSETPSGSNEVKEKIKQTNLGKYGYAAHNQQHMGDSLLLLNQSEWLSDQYSVQEKPAYQIADELELSTKTILNYLHKHNIPVRDTYYVSYKQQQWLDSLGIELIREYKIPGTRYKADGYDPTTNTIYEFHGDYWHGNPEVFEPSEMNTSIGQSFGELYEKTKIREQELLDLGYKLVVIWENEQNIVTGKQIGRAHV